MNLNEMYRVMVKQGEKFVGTGTTEEGHVTIEPKIIYQAFYTKENAEKLKLSLEGANFEVKIVQGT